MDKVVNIFNGSCTISMQQSGQRGPFRKGQKKHKFQDKNKNKGKNKKQEVKTEKKVVKKVVKIEKKDEKKVVKPEKKVEKQEENNKDAGQNQKSKLKNLKIALKKAKKTQDQEKIEKIEQQMKEMGFNITYTDVVKHQLQKWVFGEGVDTIDDQSLAMKHFNSAYNEISKFVTEVSADYIYAMVAESTNTLDHAAKIKLIKYTTKILKVYEVPEPATDDNAMAVDAEEIDVKSISESLAGKIESFLQSMSV